MHMRICKRYYRTRICDGTKASWSVGQWYLLKCSVRASSFFFLPTFSAIVLCISWLWQYVSEYKYRFGQQNDVNESNYHWVWTLFWARSIFTLRCLVSTFFFLFESGLRFLMPELTMEPCGNLTAIKHFPINDLSSQTAACINDTKIDLNAY